MFLAIAVCVILSLVTYLLYYDWKFRECLRALPGLPILPILGNALQIGRSPGDILKFALKTTSMGPVTRGKLGPYVFIHLTGPDEVESVVTDQQLIDKSHEYVLLKDWLGDGLLLSRGDKWRQRRKLLTPAFHFSILQQVVPTLEKQTSILLKKFESTIPHSVNIYPMVTLCTLDIIAETAMGVELNCQSNPDTEYVKAVQGIGSILRNRLLSFTTRFDFIFRLTPTYKVYKRYIDTMHGLTSSIIKERRKLLENEKNKDQYHQRSEESIGMKQRLSFLDTLILADTEKGKLSDEDIREEVDTFMFEGHDTTASALSFILYCISEERAVQEKIYQEQVDIFGDDLERRLTFEDFNKMKYTEMTVKESLRLYPAVPMVVRHLPHNMIMSMILSHDLHPNYSEDLWHYGTLLPEGLSLVVNIIGQNRNPAVFEDPMKFIPERFSPENSSNRHPFSFIPFSAGPRNCIGQKFAMLELKAVVSKVVRILSSGEPPDLAADLVLRTTNGIKIKFEKR